KPIHVHDNPILCITDKTPGYHRSEGFPHLQQIIPNKSTSKIEFIESFCNFQDLTPVRSEIEVQIPGKIPRCDWRKSDHNFYTVILNVGAILKKRSSTGSGWNRRTKQLVKGIGLIICQVQSKIVIEHSTG